MGLWRLPEAFVASFIGGVPPKQLWSQGPSSVPPPPIHAGQVPFYMVEVVVVVVVVMVVV